MANTIDWVEIRTGRIEEASRFYQELFGWRPMERQVVGGLQVKILDTGGEPKLENLRRVGICEVEEATSHGVIVYINVDNLDETLAKAKELGARVASHKTELPGGYSASFIDPDGNMMAIYQDRKD